VLYRLTEVGEVVAAGGKALPGKAGLEGSVPEKFAAVAAAGSKSFASSCRPPARIPN
jgi:hypothetical protein